MISILSYNVGVQRSMWDKHTVQATKAGRNRTEKVLKLLIEYEPDLLCLQEMGMHEEGLDPSEVSGAFERDAHPMSAEHARQVLLYTITTTGPYTIFRRGNQ